MYSLFQKKRNQPVSKIKVQNLLIIINLLIFLFETLGRQKNQASVNNTNNDFANKGNTCLYSEKTSVAFQKEIIINKSITINKFCTLIPETGWLRFFWNRLYMGQLLRKHTMLKNELIEEITGQVISPISAILQQCLLSQQFTQDLMAFKS